MDKIKEKEWFVVGSTALSFYGIDIGRKPGDLDILSTENKSCLVLDGLQVEHISNHDSFEKTNFELWQYCCDNKKDRIQTVLGELWVAPIEVIKAMKIASLPFKKKNNEKDLKLLEEIVLDEKLQSIVERRTIEAHGKIEKQLFFNKYPIVRFIEHDQLHQYVSQNPAYKKILSSRTMIDEGKFNQLDFNDKKLELFEETLVLVLEREFIPRYKKMPIIMKSLVALLQETKKENSWSINWLQRLTKDGAVKDRPEWISTWGRANYHLLVEEFTPWWIKKIDELSVEFWTHIIKVKDLEPLD